MEADSLGGRVSRYICARLAVVVVEVVSLWRRFAGSFMMDLVLGRCLTEQTNDEAGLQCNENDMAEKGTRCIATERDRGREGYFDEAW